jgi:endonuclease/exonuclease/phosphatase family metal-dependent hydrolase
MVKLGHELRVRGVSDRYEAFYFPAHTYRVLAGQNFYTTGLAIIVRNTLRAEWSNTSAPEDITHRRVHAVRKFKQTRICAHLRVRNVAGEAFDVFNTHLSLPTTFSRAFWTRDNRMGYGPNQLEEARNLVRFVARESASNRVVVVGDFNALPGSPVYQHVQRTGALQDPFASLHSLST